MAEVGRVGVGWEGGDGSAVAGAEPAEAASTGMCEAHQDLRSALLPWSAVLHDHETPY
jgi:hypothetical protein